MLGPDVATLLTPRACFLHVPKTGGTWVTHAMIAAGVPCREVETRVRNHYAEHGHVWLAAAAPEQALFTFAFVRHPLDWWRSFWAHRMREGWLFPAHEIDSRAASSDFGEFIGMVIERLPGFLDVLYGRFVGPSERQIDFVGRFERLTDDLVLALRLAGEQFDEAILRAYPPQNVGEYESVHASYDPALEERLARAEHRTVQRFYSDWLEPSPAGATPGQAGQR